MCAAKYSANRVSTKSRSPICCSTGAPPSFSSGKSGALPEPQPVSTINKPATKDCESLRRFTAFSPHPNLRQPRRPPGPDCERTRRFPNARVPVSNSTSACPCPDFRFSAARKCRLLSLPSVHDRFASSASSPSPERRRHGTSRSDPQRAFRRPRSHPPVPHTDSCASDSQPEPFSATSHPLAPCNRSARKPALRRETGEPADPLLFSSFSSLLPLEPTSDLLNFIRNGKTVEHRHAVRVQSELRGKEQRRPFRNVELDRRSQILRRLLPAESVRIAQPTVGFRAC